MDNSDICFQITDCFSKNVFHSLTCLGLLWSLHVCTCVSKLHVMQLAAAFKFSAVNSLNTSESTAYNK